MLLTSGIVAALVFCGLGFVLDVRAHRATNLIRLSERHRDLWEGIYTRPQLARILDPVVDLGKAPVSAEEELFMIFVILHLSDSYYALRAGFFPKPEGLRRDIRRFFGLPIPRAVWQKVRAMQDRPFVKFVEECWPEEDLAAQTEGPQWPGSDGSQARRT
jgi:hypothetical protein